MVVSAVEKTFCVVEWNPQLLYNGIIDHDSEKNLQLENLPNNSSSDEGEIAPISASYIRFVGGVMFLTVLVKGSRSDYRTSRGEREHRKAIILSTKRGRLFSCITRKCHNRYQWT
ncbi:hypothetical protein TNCV_1677781 [Trichonephila clavipes]|nr:hypothetical protein TNCV_1677781 [Trichonephila clavipes]